MADQISALSSVKPSTEGEPKSAKPKTMTPTATTARNERAEKQAEISAGKKPKKIKAPDGHVLRETESGARFFVRIRGVTDVN